MKASNSIITKSFHLHRPTTFKFHHFHQTQLPNFHNDKKIRFFRVCCKIQVPQNKSNKPISQKIVISDKAPSLNEQEEDKVGGEIPPPPKKPNSSVNKLVKRVSQKVLTALSNLPLAIGEMFAIAGLMAIGITHFSLLFMQFLAY